MVRRPGRPPRIGAATATVLTVAVLVLTNLLNNRWLHGWGLVVSPSSPSCCWGCGAGPAAVGPGWAWGRARGREACAGRVP
ncbi:hypothetical protein ACFQZC_35940 [Streptacidiphilus monticola]